MRVWMTTRDCANVLGVSTDYIRSEIRDGRLEAEVIPRPPRQGRRRAYPAIRIYPPAWATYLGTYWAQHPACGKGE